MKKADVKAGLIVGARSEEEIKKPFEGKIEKVYENSALLGITSYDPIDEAAIGDLNSKIVVNFKNLRVIKLTKDSQTATLNEIKIEKMKQAAAAAKAAEEKK